MAKGVSFNIGSYRNQYDDIFKDTDYWDTYQGILNQYKDGVPQNWWRDLTGKTQTDMYNHKMALSNALNSLVETMRSTEYNSETATTERMREAGLNPDILGTDSGSESPASPMSEQQPMQFENPVPHMVSFLSMIGGAVAGVQSMVSQKVVNSGMRLQNLSLVNELALSGLARSNIDYDPATEIMPAISLGFDTGSRSLNRKLEHAAKSFMGSLPARTARKGLERDLAKVRKEAFDITSSAGYSDDDKFYQGLADKMAEAYQLLIELEMSNKTKEFSTRNQYLDTFDPALSADADNESNTRSKSKDKQWNKFMSIEHGIIKYIRDEANKGNPDAIDLIFRIFGEQTHTSNALSPFKEIGLGIEGNYPITRGK